MKVKILFIIASACFIYSCTQKNEKTIVITNFKNKFTDSLIPNNSMKNSGYLKFNVKIKGYVNDSIKINLEDGNDNTSFYLNGKIDNSWLYEYSGCCPRYIQIDPYKASKGKIEIKYGLY